MPKDNIFIPAPLEVKGSKIISRKEKERRIKEREERLKNAALKAVHERINRGDKSAEKRRKIVQELLKD